MTRCGRSTDSLVSIWLTDQEGEGIGGRWQRGVEADEG